MNKIKPIIPVIGNFYYFVKEKDVNNSFKSFYVCKSLCTSLKIIENQFQLWALYTNTIEDIDVKKLKIRFIATFLDSESEIFEYIYRSDGNFDTDDTFKFKNQYQIFENKNDATNHLEEVKCLYIEELKTHIDSLSTIYEHKEEEISKDILLKNYLEEKRIDKESYFRNTRIKDNYFA
jgi:hypothetical protein